MEDLKLNLAKNEFSIARKILLWVIALLFILVSFWNLYLKIVKHDISANTSLTIALFSISAFMIFIAALASMKKKDHYFTVTNKSISYRYGLLFSRHRSHDWEEVDKIRMPKNAKGAILILKNGKEENINLTWIEKTKSSIIRRHIYYSAKNRDIQIIRK